MKQDKFISVHNHSEYSNLRLKDATNKIEDMINYVSKDLKQKGLAITDHESLSGHIDAIKIVQEGKKNGTIDEDFKLILGNEIYLIDEEEMKTKLENKEKVDFYHFILLAKNQEGHHQLRQLSSRAWKRMINHKGMDRVPTFKSDIEEIVKGGHIIASTACLGGELPKIALNYLKSENEEDKEYWRQKINEFVYWGLDTFGDDNFYIEIQPSDLEDQRIFNKLAVDISKAIGVPMIITTDAHYLSEEDRPIHKAFLTSEEGNNQFREVDEFYATTRFFKEEELYEYLDYLPREIVEECINNTNIIANSVENYDWFAPTLVPKVPLPPQDEWYKFDTSILENYPAMKELYYNEEPQDEYIIHQIFRGIDSKIKEEDIEETLKRVEIECDELVGLSKAKNQPFSAYLLTMQSMMDVIWEESFVGVGRGSAVCWVINYLLGITDINPLKQPIEMQHWRFASKERVDIFDIDIDLNPLKKDYVVQKTKDYFESFGGSVVKVCTFRTESAKSIIKTVCRGLGINGDVADYLSSLVPVSRGFVQDVKTTYYGDEKKGILPVAEFKNIVDQYQDLNLLGTMIKLEGIISGRGQHASGVFYANHPLEDCDSYMRTPNGELVSQYSLHTGEEVSELKFDLLVTDAQSKLQTCLNLLLEYGKIEDQGSLRKNYEKYLHPDILDLNNQQLWDNICQGNIIDAFQFSTPVGSRAIQAIQPRALLELANGNALMRLQTDDEIKPLQKYVMYKNDITLCYKEMEDYGLNQEEIEIMKELFIDEYGVCCTQESLMRASMHPKLSNYTMVEANVIRKVIGKKQVKKIPETKETFYRKCIENGCREILPDYVWNKQFNNQMSYAFSIPHCTAYSWILCQEAWLYTIYPSVYWNTAVLQVNSGSIEEEGKKEAQSNTAKISSAIGQLQDNGVNIANPNINTSQIGFTPDEENNRIIVGFKPISNINNEMAKEIIKARPFKSLQDFYERMTLTKVDRVLSTGKVQKKSIVPESALISLIKSGAFDELEDKPREQIMEEFLHKIYPDKKSLTNKDIDKIQEIGLFPPEFDEYLKIYNYIEAVKECPKRQDTQVKSIKWAKLVDSDIEYQERLINFFEDNFMAEMTEGRDYQYDENGDLEVALSSRKGSIQDIYKIKTKPMQDYLKSEECKKAYNEYRFNEYKKSVAGGTPNDWEFESMGYYSKQYGHALAKVNLDNYMISNFGELPEEPEIEDWFKIKGNKYPKFKTSRICGTIIDKNINKHFITVLTSDGKVVNCKMNKGQIAFYNKQISMGEGKDKVVLEKSWFERGTKIFLHGYRMGQDFRCKTYNNSIYGKHTLKLIEEVYPDGTLKIKSERLNIDELE